MEPYECYDRDLLIMTTADTILQVLEGKLLPRVAWTNGQMRLHGDAVQLAVLPFGGK